MQPVSCKVAPGLQSPCSSFPQVLNPTSQQVVPAGAQPVSTPLTPAASFLSDLEDLVLQETEDSHSGVFLQSTNIPQFDLGALANLSLPIDEVFAPPLNPGFGLPVADQPGLPMTSCFPIQGTSEFCQPPPINCAQIPGQPTLCQPDPMPCLPDNGNPELCQHIPGPPTLCEPAVGLSNTCQAIPGLPIPCTPIQGQPNSCFPVSIPPPIIGGPGPVIPLPPGIIPGQPLGSFNAGNFKASWTLVMIEGKPALEITMSALTNGWIAIGWSLGKPHIAADIVVGAVINGQGVIEDRYSLGYAQVVLDLKKNVELVAASETGGITLVTFRRLLDTFDPLQDVPILNQEMLIQWAYGITDDFGKHDTASRGIIRLNFLSPSGLLFDPTLPLSITGNGITLLARPTILRNKAKGLIFTLSARTTGWVGFGFSTSKAHLNTDMVIGKVVNGVPVIEDFFSRTSAQIEKDTIENFELIGGSEINGVTTINFVRALDTGDSLQDIAIPNAPVLVQLAFGQTDQFNIHLTNAQYSVLANLQAPTPPPGGIINAAGVTVAFQPLLLKNSIPAIQFQITAPTLGWVSVGWSLLGSHVQTDMVVGFVENGIARVEDRFSPVLGTPFLDPIQNVELVSGSEENGVTMITFVRPLITADPQDIPIVNTRYIVHVAYGLNDVFTQHPLIAAGIAEVNFLAPALPPFTGSVEGAGVSLQYFPVFLPNKIPALQMTMTAPTKGWVSVGWSTLGPHVWTDMIFGYVDSFGQPKLEDRFSQTLGPVPVLDKSQDVFLVGGYEENGMTSITFIRPLKTPDPFEDVPIGDMTLLLQLAYGDTDDTNIQHAPGKSAAFPINFGNPALVPPLGQFQALQGQFNASWNIVPGPKGKPAILMNISALTQGWVGIGWSAEGISHQNTDLIVCAVLNGAPLIKDAFSLSLGIPFALDKKMDVSLIAAKEDNGITSCLFQRTLESFDNVSDIDILNQMYLVQYAFGDTDDFNIQHDIDSRGVIQANFITGAVTGANPGTFTSPDGDMTLQWSTVNGGQALLMTVTAQTNGWIGFGLMGGRNAHSNADLIQVLMNDTSGLPQAIDGMSRTFGAPIPDASQDITVLSGSQQNGVTTVTFVRPMLTTDSCCDLPIVDGGQVFVWAMGADDNVAYTIHRPNARGRSMANFVSGRVLVVLAAFNPATSFAVTIGLILLIYVFFRFAYKCCKFYRIYFFGPRKNDEPVFRPEAEDGSVSENDEHESRKARMKHYYRGSEAIRYKKRKRSYSLDGSDYDSQYSEDEDEDEDQEECKKDDKEETGEEKPKFERSKFSKTETASSQKIEEKAAKLALSNACYRFFYSRFCDSQVTFIDAVVWTLFVFINIGYVAIWQVRLFNDVGANLGYVAAANAFFVMLPATRKSILTFLLGLPFDRAIMYHRWIGRLIFYLSTAHLLYFLVLDGIDGMLGFVFTFPKYITGTIAWIFLVIIFLTSFGFIRRRAFNFFYTMHFAFIGFYIVAAFHSTVFIPFAAAAGVLWIGDRIIRLIYGAFPVKSSEFKLLPGDIVRVRFPKNCMAKYELGQYVFVNFPRISFFEWHPFTISSGPEEPEIELNIRSLGNYTRSLIEDAKKSMAIQVRVDGPYGKWPFNYSRYRKVMLVGGGVGVTPCIAALRHLYQINILFGKTEPIVKEVIFVWSCKNEESYKWFEDVIEECWSKSGTMGFPKLKAYIYLTQEGHTKIPRLLTGRPNFKCIFEEVETDSIVAHRIAVIACGPRKLTNQVWDMTIKHSRKDMRFDFHHETFEF